MTLRKAHHKRCRREDWQGEASKVGNEFKKESAIPGYVCKLWATELINLNKCVFRVREITVKVLGLLPCCCIDLLVITWPKKVVIECISRIRDTHGGLCHVVAFPRLHKLIFSIQLQSFLLIVDVRIEVRGYHIKGSVELVGRLIAIIAFNVFSVSIIHCDAARHNSSKNGRINVYSYLLCDVWADPHRLLRKHLFKPAFKRLAKWIFIPNLIGIQISAENRLRIVICLWIYFGDLVHDSCSLVNRIIQTGKVINIGVQSHSQGVTILWVDLRCSSRIVISRRVLSKFRTSVLLM